MLNYPNFQADDGANGTTDNSVETTAIESKVFTQEQVNELVGKARKEARERELKALGVDDGLTKDDIKNYKQWKESQKTEQERINEEKALLLKERDEYKAKAFESLSKLKLKDSGANDVDYVMFKVNQTMVDGDFDGALAKLQADMPNLFNKQIETVTGNKIDRKETLESKDIFEKYKAKYNIK